MIASNHIACLLCKGPIQKPVYVPEIKMYIEIWSNMPKTFFAFNGRAWYNVENKYKITNEEPNNVKPTI